MAAVCWISIFIVSNIFQLPVASNYSTSLIVKFCNSCQASHLEKTFLILTFAYIVLNVSPLESTINRQIHPIQPVEP